MRSDIGVRGWVVADIWYSVRSELFANGLAKLWGGGSRVVGFFGGERDGWSESLE